MTTDRARDTTGRASAPDLPDSKLTNFDDPNSSKRALSAASSACLYSSFSRKEPKIGQFSSVYLLQISWRLSLTLFQEIFFLLAVITFHLYDGGHTDLVHLVRISVLAGNFSSPSAVAKLSIRAADLKLPMRKIVGLIDCFSTGLQVETQTFTVPLNRTKLLSGNLKARNFALR